MVEFVNTFITAGFLGPFVAKGGSVRALPIKAKAFTRPKHTLVCTFKDGAVQILNDRHGEVKGANLDSLIALLRRETSLESVVVGTEYGKDVVVPTETLEWKELE